MVRSPSPKNKGQWVKLFKNIALYRKRNCKRIIIYARGGFVPRCLRLVSDERYREGALRGINRVNLNGSSESFIRLCHFPAGMNMANHAPPGLQSRGYPPCLHHHDSRAGFHTQGCRYRCIQQYLSRGDTITVICIYFPVR